MDGDVYNYLLFRLMRGIKDYDIIMIELTSQVFRIVKSIKRVYPEKKLIGVLEGSLHSLDNDHTLKNRIGFIETYREVDALGILIKDSISYFKSITNKPVFWLGVPFPVEWSRQYIISPEKKEPIIEIYTSFTSGKGGITNWFTFNNLQKLHPTIKGYTYSHKRRLEEALAKKFGINLNVLPFRDWPQYFANHCKAYIGLHMDYRWSWNRYSVDCAAAGIPCISTNHSTAHKFLFPMLCVDPYDVNAAVKLASKLLEDGSFYRECREYALEKIEQFNYYNSSVRLKNFLITQGWIDG